MSEPRIESFVALGVGAAAAAWSPRVRRYLWADEPPPADEPASAASVARASDDAVGGERRERP